MLIHRLVQLCWCALALCLWIFADILRHNLLMDNTIASTEVGCGLVNSTPRLPEGDIELYKEGKNIFRNYCFPYLKHRANIGK